jgi:prepilin peptidase CpaA
MDKYLLICASAIAMAGAFHDARSRRIPNQLTLTAMAAGFGARAALGGWLGLESALWGALLAGGVFFLFFVVGGMGGGDVKLMAAVGAWAGVGQVTPILLVAALAGGVLAIAYMIVDGTVLRTLRNTIVLAQHHLTAGLRPHPELNIQESGTTRVPFGVAIAAGTLFCAVSALLRR